MVYKRVIAAYLMLAVIVVAFIAMPFIYNPYSTEAYVNEERILFLASPLALCTGGFLTATTTWKNTLIYVIVALIYSFGLIFLFEWAIMPEIVDIKLYFYILFNLGGMWVTPRIDILALAAIGTVSGLAIGIATRLISGRIWTKPKSEKEKVPWENF